MPRGLRKGERKRVADRPISTVEIVDDLKNLPLLLKDTDVSRIFGISASTLRKGRVNGLIRGADDLPPHVRVSGRIYYRRSDLEKWLAGLTPRSAAS